MSGRSLVIVTVSVLAMLPARLSWADPTYGGTVYLLTKDSQAKVRKWNEDLGYEKSFVNLTNGVSVYVMDEIKVVKGTIRIVFRDDLPEDFSAGSRFPVPFKIKGKEESSRKRIDGKTTQGAKRKGSESHLLMPPNGIEVPARSFEIDLIEDYTGEAAVTIFSADGGRVYDGKVQFNHGAGPSPVIGERLEEERKRAGNVQIPGHYAVAVSYGGTREEKPFKLMTAKAEEDFLAAIRTAESEPDLATQTLALCEVYSRCELYPLAFGQMRRFEALMATFQSPYERWAISSRRLLRELSLAGAGFDPKSERFRKDQLLLDDKRL